MGFFEYLFGFDPDEVRIDSEKRNELIEENDHMKKYRRYQVNIYRNQETGEITEKRGDTWRVWIEWDDGTETTVKQKTIPRL